MSRLVHRLFTICIALMASGFATGCAKKTHPVEGQVVFEDGTPARELAGYGIAFHAKDVAANANGTIQPDGSFTVGTFADGDGAPLGKHRVAITPPPPKIDEPRKPPLIAKKYSSADTSELTVDVTAQANKVTLKVERAK